MDKWLKIILIGCISFLSILPAFAAHHTLNLNTPVGYWKTIDDVTGKPRAILQIVEKSDHTIYGRILKTFANDANEKENHDICSKCKGERHNRPIIGLIIMENLKKNGNEEEWGDGEILDPKTGKTYHCSLRVIDNGQKLSVRGYIGLPLFGRSQTWLRVTDPNGGPNKA